MVQTPNFEKRKILNRKKKKIGKNFGKRRKVIIFALLINY